MAQPELSATTLEAALAELAPQLLVVRSTKVLAPALAAAPGLELVVRAGAGVDNIDLAAAHSPRPPLPAPSAPSALPRPLQPRPALCASSSARTHRLVTRCRSGAPSFIGSRRCAVPRRVLRGRQGPCSAQKCSFAQA
jgi:hypothetical protein